MTNKFPNKHNMFFLEKEDILDNFEVEFIKFLIFLKF